MAQRRRACERLPLPLPPTYSLVWRSRGGETWGGTWDQLRPLPHVPRLSRPNGVRKPPSEDVRTALGRKESAPGPRRRSGGPSACGDVLSRVGWQALFSRRMPRGSHAASGQPVARRTRQ